MLLIGIITLVSIAFMFKAQSESGNRVSEEDRYDYSDTGKAFEGSEFSEKVSIVINVAARKLYLYEYDKLIETYPICIGQRGYKTPVWHRMKLGKIIWNPWWIPPDSPWAAGESPTPPGSKSNPLGPVKMLLDMGIRIHGTTKNSSIGGAQSHGCIRMYNEDAAELAWKIQRSINEDTDDSMLEMYSAQRTRDFHIPLNENVSVEIIYEPIEIAGDKLYIYNDVYGKAPSIKSELISLLIKKGITIDKVNERKLGLLKYPKDINDVTTIELKDLMNDKDLDFEMRTSPTNF